MLYSEKLKPKLIKAGMRHIRNESAEEIACAQDCLRRSSKITSRKRMCIFPACLPT